MSSETHLADIVTQMILVPLREKAASERGRMRGRADLSDWWSDNLRILGGPSSDGFADTFSRKGRRNLAATPNRS